MTDTPYQYDVCFSFAYEDQDYVEAVANKLRSMDVRLFYAPFEENKLWGEDLTKYFSQIYSEKSRYCVMFISKHYAVSLWAEFEQENARARAFRESERYILPARFDKTEIPVLKNTMGYKNIADISPEDFADFIYKTVKGNDYEPPEPESLETRPSKPINIPEVNLRELNPRGSKPLIILGVGILILALLFSYWLYKSKDIASIDCNVADPPINCILGKQP